MTGNYLSRARLLEAATLVHLPVCIFDISFRIDLKLNQDAYPQTEWGVHDSAVPQSQRCLKSRA